MGIGSLVEKQSQKLHKEKKRKNGCSVVVEYYCGQLKSFYIDTLTKFSH